MTTAERQVRNIIKNDISKMIERTTIQRNQMIIERKKMQEIYLQKLIELKSNS